MASNHDNKLKRLLTWTAAAIALTTVIAVSTDHLLTAYKYESDRLQNEADLAAAAVSRIIYQAPETWLFQEGRIAELLASIGPEEHRNEEAFHREGHLVRVIDNEGRVVLELGEEPSAPNMLRISALSDGFNTVGRVELIQNVRHIWERAAIAFSLGLALGIAMFIILKTLPLRALAQRESALEAAKKAAHISEQQAISAHTRLTDAIEAVADGFALYDSEDRLVLCNSRYRELYNKSADLLVPGVRFEDHIRESAYRGQVIEAIGREEAWVQERVVHHQNPHGAFEQQLVNGRWLLVHEHQTAEGGSVGIRVDITEIKRTEKKLQEREMRIRGIMDNVVDAVITIDETGKIESFNPAAEKTFGYAADEALGQNINLIMQEPDRSKHDDYLRAYLRSGVAKVVGKASREVTGRRKDGSLVPLDFDVSEMWVGDQRLFIGLLRDITQRKETEEQLRQAQKQEAVGQLTGGIAHDFNNILGIVIGKIELLSELIEDDSDEKKYAESAIQAALRGADLTGRLLAFARKQTLEPQSTDINKLVLETTELLRRTLGEGIEIETVLAGGVWSAMIDPSQLENALFNLSINARDAMPEGGKLTIETSNARLDDAYAAEHKDVTPGRYVMVAVTDAGTGMAPEVVSRVFDPFFTTKEVGKGTGLGLSMVYGFVKQSGGHIKIYSEEGHGTTVRLYLPKSIDAGKTSAPKEESLSMPGGDETILVVEDDTDVRNVAVTVLEKLGYNVLTAGDGPTALSIIDSAPEIDLMFTDVVLPKGMNGGSLAQEAAARIPGLKTLFTSGYTDNAILHHGKLDEGVHLLNKPYRKHHLAQKVRAVLDLDRG